MQKNKTSKFTNHFKQISDSQTEFSIVSYNILADSLLAKYKSSYSYVLDQKYLDPEYRLNLLV